MSVSASLPVSAEKTWATASDLSRFGEWLVLHDGWRGPVPEIGPGARLTSVVVVKGLRNRVDWTVETYDPPHSLTLSGRGVGGVRIAVLLSVRSTPAGSTMRFEAQITGRPVFGPIGMLIGRALKGDVQRSVDGLARLVH